MDVAVAQRAGAGRRAVGGGAAAAAGPRAAAHAILLLQPRHEALRRVAGHAVEGAEAADDDRHAAGRHAAAAATAAAVARRWGVQRARAARRGRRRACQRRVAPRRGARVRGAAYRAARWPRRAAGGDGGAGASVGPNAILAGVRLGDGPCVRVDDGASLMSRSLARHRRGVWVGRGPRAQRRRWRSGGACSQTRDALSWSLKHDCRGERGPLGARAGTGSPGDPQRSARGSPQDDNAQSSSRMRGRRRAAGHGPQRAAAAPRRGCPWGGGVSDPPRSPLTPPHAGRAAAPARYGSRGAASRARAWAAARRRGRRGARRRRARRRRARRRARLRRRARHRGRRARRRRRRRRVRRRGRLG